MPILLCNACQIGSFLAPDDRIRLKFNVFKESFSQHPVRPSRKKLPGRITLPNTPVGPRHGTGSLDTRSRMIEQRKANSSRNLTLDSGLSDAGSEDFYGSRMNDTASTLQLQTSPEDYDEEWETGRPKEERIVEAKAEYGEGQKKERMEHDERMKREILRNEVNTVELKITVPSITIENSPIIEYTQCQDMQHAHYNRRQAGSEQEYGSMFGQRHANIHEIDDEGQSFFAEGGDSRLSSDPRIRFLGAPSELMLAEHLRTLHQISQRAKGSSREVQHVPQGVAAVQKLERAILPDGTIYELRTTLVPDPSFHLTRDTSMQTGFLEE